MVGAADPSRREGARSPRTAHSIWSSSTTSRRRKCLARPGRGHCPAVHRRVHPASGLEAACRGRCKYV